MIRVFLGGYVNSINAQNLNCLALARHLDSRKFQTALLALWSGESVSLPNTKIFQCGRPHRLFLWLAYLRGVLWCDVAYLPKREMMGWVTWLCRLLGKPSFYTLEGILDPVNYAAGVATIGSEQKFLASFRGADRCFAITRYIRDYQHHNVSLSISEQVLPLGIDLGEFGEPRTRVTMREVVFVGRMLRRKGIFELLEVAGQLPHLQFNFAGEGEDQNDFIHASSHMTNVVYHGALDRAALGDLLKRMDVHCLLSRSEGFPRVILETAAMGIPSIVYGDYGAGEWIDSGNNGFIVTSPQQVVALLNQLDADAKLLSGVSEGALSLAAAYDWRTVSSAWESEIENLAGSRS